MNWWLHWRYYFILYSCKKTKLLSAEPVKSLLLTKSCYSSLSGFLCKIEMCYVAQQCIMWLCAKGVSPENENLVESWLGPTVGLWTSEKTNLFTQCETWHLFHNVKVYLVIFWRGQNLLYTRKKHHSFALYKMQWYFQTYVCSNTKY